MGSTGSGSFTDYSGGSGKSEGAGSGGSSGDDRCSQAFSTGLEDVEEYDFYLTTNNVPVVGSQISLVHENRIIAVDHDGKAVGALPTKFNYLAACIKDGFKYTGVVTASTSKPTPQVNADFGNSLRDD